MDEKRFIEILDNMLDKKFEENNKMMFNYIDEKFQYYDAVNSEKFNYLIERIIRLEKNMNREFNNIDKKIDEVEQRINKKFDSILTMHGIRISELENKVASM